MTAFLAPAKRRHEQSAERFGAWTRRCSAGPAPGRCSRRRRRGSAHSTSRTDSIPDRSHAGDTASLKVGMGTGGGTVCSTGFECCRSSDRKNGESSVPDLSLCRWIDWQAWWVRPIRPSPRRIGFRSPSRSSAPPKSPRRCQSPTTACRRWLDRRRIFRPLCRETPDFPLSSAFRRSSETAGPRATLRGGQLDPMRSGVPSTRILSHWSRTGP